MPKPPHSREDHRQSEFICFFEDFLVADTATRLDDGTDAVLRSFLHGVREGEEGVTRHHGTFRPVTGSALGDPQRIDADSLSAPDADGPFVFYKHDRVRRSVLHLFPSEEHVVYLCIRWFFLRDAL